MKVISVKGIHKTYPSNRKGKPVHALKGIDLEVEEGTVFSILGPNGAGKTTLISILTTLLYPDEGRGMIGGFDLLGQRSKIREVVNITSGNANFTDHFSIVENLNYYGMLYGMSKSLRKSKIERLIKMFELGAYRETPFNQLSTGLKQRLALAKSLMNTPKVLFLDEPTVGLDPQICKSIRLMLKEINRQDGLTIILTTHQMDEAEFLSDRIAFLREGTIIAEGGPEELKRRVLPREVIEIQYEGVTPGSDRLASVKGVLKVETRGDHITFSVDDPGKSLDPLLRALTSEPRITIKDIHIREADLEDVFLELAKTPGQDRGLRAKELADYEKKRIPSL